MYKTILFMNQEARFNIYAVGIMEYIENQFYRSVKLFFQTTSDYFIKPF